MRKSFRKSLDKIVAKRDSNNREDSADTEKNEDMTQDVGIMDEGNVPKNSPGTPIPSNTNLMLELNLKLENEDSEKAITTSATPPPIPSSPKPVFQDSPPSLPQVPKQRSKIPRFSRSDSLVDSKINNDSLLIEALKESDTAKIARKVSASKIPRMMGVKSSHDMISSSLTSENQRSVKSVDQIVETRRSLDQHHDRKNNILSVVHMPDDPDNESRNSINVTNEENSAKRLSGSSSNVSRNSINVTKDEKKLTRLSSNNNVTSEEKTRKISNIPKLMSPLPVTSTLPVPKNDPRSMSLPSVMTSPIKMSETEASSSETNLRSSLPRKLSNSKIPQPVNVKKEIEDSIPKTMSKKDKEEDSST